MLHLQKCPELISASLNYKKKQDKTDLQWNTCWLPVTQLPVPGMRVQSIK